MNADKWLGAHTVYVVEAGSHAYGTNTPESDHDYRGACIPPKNYFFGLDNFEQADGRDTGRLVAEGLKHKMTRLVKLVAMPTLQRLPDSDITVWSLAKMIKLAAEGNPNMIELLFTGETNIVFIDESVMRPFFDIRQSFLSKLLKHRFSGYAMSQLKRMRNHHRWHNNPPKKPTREEYGIEGVQLPKDQIGSALRMVELQVEEWLVDQTHLPEDIKIQLGPQMIKIVNTVVEQLQIESQVDELKDVLERAANRTLGFDSDFLNFLQRYKRYKNAKADYKSYQNWLANRNPTRAKLERAYGFDSKHAMHLVRLLRMAREILEGKGVVVHRPDAEELLAIRNGAWSYDELISWAEQEDQNLDQLMETSALPKSPDRKLIGETLAEVTSAYLLKYDHLSKKEKQVIADRISHDIQ